MARSLASNRSTRAALALHRHGAAIALGGICMLAAFLRLWLFTRTPPNPFYDAAVRSMGTSWHNFLYGAFEPGGSVSVDKTPVDLWFQVASTKLLGFSSTSLRLPQAIAGTLAVPLLYDLVRRGFGRRAALVSAAALAVLPVSVLSSRSDTMDTVMATTLLAAAWVIVAATPRWRPRAIVIAGALAGLAFEIKLFEATVALPGLALLAWLALDVTVAERRRILLRALIAFVASAAVWPVLATLAPGQHPWPIGSTNGIIWNVILIFNGLNRLGASGPGSMDLAGAGPLRLFTTQQPNYLTMLGVELLPALTLGSIAVLAARRRQSGPPRGAHDRLRRALGAGLGVWLLCGFALFSVQGRVRLRYFEAFTPAVAATFGIGVAVCAGLIARRERWRPATAAVSVALLTAALLTQPMLTSIRLARIGAEDSQTLGAMPAGQVDALSRYLHAHQGGARYEVAGAGAVVSGPLIVRDAEPILLVTSWHGRPLISSADLTAKIRAGEVRHLLSYANTCRTP